MCKKPYIKADIPFGCGQCLPCRINRRRLWTHRLVLEGMKHEESIFVTLTYSPENYPQDGSLVPKHAQDWLKRLRKAVHPCRIRFYLVGEYGEKTWRAHYHAVIFGMGVRHAALVAETWGLGHVLTGSLTSESAAYVAGYVTKKMTSADDERLNGRYPEFCRMSLRPGIGAGATDEIVEFLTSDIGSRYLVANGDVPTVLKHGGRSLPLGRYLRRLIREKMDIPEKGFDSPACQKTREEMQMVFKNAFGNFRATAHDKAAILVEHNTGKIRRVEARFKIFKRKEAL